MIPSEQPKRRRRSRRLTRLQLAAQPLQTPADTRRPELNVYVDPFALRAWRRKRYLSQFDLGSLLGIDLITIQRWERGHHSIPPYLQLALERLEQLMFWHPDGARLKEGQTTDSVELHAPRHRAASTVH